MRRKVLVFSSILLIIFLLVVGSGKVAQTTIGNTKIVTEESVTINIVKQVTPAVVTVGITANQPVINWGYGFGTKQVKQDIGSGFIVRGDGLIVTNKHVVSDGAADYSVVTTDGKTHQAKVLARDPVQDIAVIKIDGAGYPTLQLGNSGSV